MERHSARLEIPFAALLPGLRQAATEFGLSLSEQHSRASLQLHDGCVSLVDLGAASEVMLEAETRTDLAELRDAVTTYVEAQNLPARLEWARVAPVGRPLNLTLAQIGRNDRLSPSFHRLRLVGDFSSFVGGGIHFRLIFGPEGADWPSNDANGAAVWPCGIDVWHRPPYTIRAMDSDRRWIDIDVFLHEGGRVTDWILGARPGDVVGLTGPGGKAPQIADWICYIGDETALPVIARMLEVLPASTKGIARIFVNDPADAQPVGCPASVDLQWVVRNGSGGPLDALKAIEPPSQNRFIFFAGERQDAVAAREHLAAIGLGRGEFHAAAYWTEGWIPPADQARPRPRRQSQV